MILLSVLFFFSPLHAAEKVAVEATKFALKPAIISLTKDLYKQTKLATSISYGSIFIHELSHATTALALGYSISSFSFTKEEGRVSRSRDDNALKNIAISAAGPIGGMSYLAYIIHKNRSFPAQIPFWVINNYVWKHFRQLMPIESGCDGDQIISNFKGLSLEKMIENIQEKKLADEELAYWTQYTPAVGFLLTTGFAKYKGYTLLGKPFFKILPSMLILQCFGPSFKLYKDDSGTWKYLIQNDPSKEQ